MNKIEVHELLNVLESIRTEKYPNIPAELIAQIVQTQFEYQDDRSEGNHKTRNLIDEFLITLDDTSVKEGAQGA